MRNANRFASFAAFVGLLLGGSAAATAREVDYLHAPWPLTDIFDTPPQRAHAVAGSACEIAERYVELVNAKRNDEVGALFARDAAFLDPQGNLIQGREAITAWYARSAGGNAVIPVAFHSVGRECFMEAAGHIDVDPDPHFRLLVIDHFTLNDKREIARAVYYFRPASIEAARKIHTQK